MDLSGARSYNLDMTRDLIDDLEDLRVALHLLHERLEKSGVARTTGLKVNMGDDCHYYRKSKDLFLQRDYEQVRDLVLKAVSQFRLIEGDGYAR